MSTEAKKEKALSSEEMSGVAGGGNANSKDGTPGGPEFLIDPNDQIKQTSVYVV